MATKQVKVCDVCDKEFKKPTQGWKIWVEADIFHCNSNESDPVKVHGVETKDVCCDDCSRILYDRFLRNWTLEEIIDKTPDRL